MSDLKSLFDEEIQETGHLVEQESEVFFAPLSFSMSEEIKENATNSATTLSKKIFRIGEDVVIYKPNTLVDSKYNLSVGEFNLFTLALTKCFQQGGISPFVAISAEEFADANNLGYKNAYRQLLESAQRLSNQKVQSVVYHDKNMTSIAVETTETNESSEEEREKFKQYSLNKTKNKRAIKHTFNILGGFSEKDEIEYATEKSSILIHLSSFVMYLINNIDKGYIKYDYKKTVAFKGFYTKRLYELCCKKVGIDKKRKTYIELEVEEWKDMFDCANKYDKIAQFKRWVFDPAIRDINTTGDFVLSYEHRRTGRSITSIIINIEDCRPVEENLTADNVDSKQGNAIPQETDEYAEIIEYSIANYIDHLVSHGETVSGFRIQNIRNKAFAEKWGVEEFLAQKEKESRKQYAIKKAVQNERKAEQEEQKAWERHQQTINAYIMQYELLEKAQQAKVLAKMFSIIKDENMDNLVRYFNKSIICNECHKSPILSPVFLKAMDLLKKEK